MYEIYVGCAGAKRKRINHVMADTRQMRLAAHPTYFQKKMTIIHVKNSQVLNHARKVSYMNFLRRDALISVPLKQALSFNWLILNRAHTTAWFDSQWQPLITSQALQLVPRPQSPTPHLSETQIG